MIAAAASPRARAALTVAAALLLGGCAATSLDQLKADPAKVYAFHSPRDYRTAFTLIADKAEHCWQGRVLFATLNVDATLNVPGRAGEVTFWMENFGRRIYGDALIAAAGEGSDVTVWTYLSTWDEVGPRIERWVQGQEGCD